MLQKNWALAMMLKALPLAHFWSVLLLKEEMMISVKKVCLENSCNCSAKSADFSANFSLKIP